MKSHFVPLLSVGLFLVSLFVPAIVYDKGVQTGLSVLSVGWMGMFDITFAWLANPLYLFALISTRAGKFKKAAVLTALALGLGAQSFFFSRYPQDEGGVNVWGVDYLGIGFYLWMVSIATLLLYAIWRNQQVETKVSR